MSQQIICDRCGVILPPKMKVMEIVIGQSGWASRMTKHDLCKDCLRKLRRFLKSPLVDMDEEE